MIANFTFCVSSYVKQYPAV